MGVEELKSMTHEDLVRKVQELQEDLDDLEGKLKTVADMLRETLKMFG